MRKLFLFSVVVLGLSSAPAFAQAVSGGQATQAGGNDIRANPYNSTNVGDQYSQQRQISNLPGQPTADASKLGPARPAKANELTLGAMVNDKAGVLIATIDRVDTDGVVLSDGGSKVKVPADSFGHNKAGLLLDMSKADFDKIVARANAAH